MRDYEKPTIILSKCINEEPCRYDGTKISNSFVKILSSYVNFIKVCPEVGIGLPIPRDTLRLVLKDEVERLVFSKSGEDMTDVMEEFTNSFMGELGTKKIHGAILKSRSPSCGMNDVKLYNDYGKGRTIGNKSSGLFAKGIFGSFPYIPIENEGRLTNYNIREEFLTRIFTKASFDNIKNKKSMKELVRFHSENKYLLMCHSQRNLKELGQITANHEKLQIDEVLVKYEYSLEKALSISSKPMRNVNMLLHLFGYFSKYITKDEKVFFLDTLESYSDKRVPFSVPLALIYSWVMRFENKYLLNQTIFNPYPKELVDLRDSGKST
ncbi:MAG: DUF523 and DUF1722 domain-containing protein [Anaeromicrobium sp.]|jgi:uncharacterized protein YbgA (DUF1722 family)/uncharacterized protein YbbK (DUF523 family)|uniref:YbgA family protein n=1 Tax=Anaeromicrobium sp. TaxID=1929132 RepID=UPI002600FA6D|nr:DUF523 and DUF1722 domain-containing protein [Anaeromicrobium sp.]MCT4595126.1 DUF523 and DUF1722 domain-containing protein [Anaeromicrobium sp.]